MDDRLTPFEAAFSRLLFDRAFRETVRAGDRSGLGATAEAFANVDFVQLETLATAIRDGLIEGGFGGLSVRAAFPQVIAALGGGPQAVVERYLAAYASVARVDCTGRRAGVSVYESVFGWAEAQLLDRPAARCAAQHEFAAALLAVLARTPSPGFLVRWPLVRSIGRAWCCVLDAERPLEGLADIPERPAAYVAVVGRYAAGEGALDLAAVLLDGLDDCPPWARARVAAMDADDRAVLRGVAQRATA